MSDQKQSNKTIEQLKQELSPAELKQLLKEAEEQEKQELQERKKQYQQKRDQFVQEKVDHAKWLSSTLAHFKRNIIQNGQQLHEEMLELFNAKRADVEQIGKQFSLITEDGKYKLTIEREAKVNLDESAEAGIQKIRNYMETHVKKRDKMIYGMLEELLMKNKKGEWDEKLVAKLSKYEEQINNQEFSEGLDILRKAYREVDSSYYVRFYEKNAETGAWDNIPLQWSSL
jgi:Glu-tRNA(Gln) amidotransferase subunit E-like FAD-binding protein